MKPPPPNIPGATVVHSVDELPDGGARRLKDHVAPPLLKPAGLRAMVDQAQPANSPDWISEYKSKFALMNQGGSGGCTAPAASTAIQWRRYRKDGKAIDLSWPYLYYVDVMYQDPTNRYGIIGSMVSKSMRTATNGICTDALWSQTAAFSPDIHTGVRRRPSPAAYADAATRKVLKMSSVPADPQVWMQLINAGYFISGAIAAHAVCFGMYTDAYWFVALDSLRADEGGIRVFNRDLLLASGWDFCVVEDVTVGEAVPIITPPSNPSVVSPPTTQPQTSQGQQMLIDTIKAEANALVAGQVTQAQIDKLKADVGMLVVDTPALPHGDFHDPAIWYPPFDEAHRAEHGAGNLPGGFSPPYFKATDFSKQGVEGTRYYLTDNGDGSITEYTASGNNPNGVDDTGTRIPRFNMTGTPNPNANDRAHTFAQQKAAATGAVTPPVTPPAGTSPDRTVINAPTGTITDPRGRVWGWGGNGPHGGGYQIMMNGVSTGGEAVKMIIVGGFVYCLNTEPAWFKIYNDAGTIVWEKKPAGFAP